MWNSLHRFGAVALVVLVAAQAVIAGQHLFGSWGIGVHAALGNAAFTIAVALVAVAWAKLDHRRLPLVAIAIAVLLTAQIGLGYSTRDSESAAALHIPLGVAVFGAVVYQLLVAWPALLGRATPADAARDPRLSTKRQLWLCDSRHPTSSRTSALR